MAVDPEVILASAFEDGRPVVLFVGQAFEVRDGTPDAVLTSLLARHDFSDERIRWVDALKFTLTASDFEWLAGRYDRHVPSEGALAAYELPWSAVFSSSFDQNLARRLETRGRQPEAVLSSGTFARVPRSRSRPPIHYILGRAGETAGDAAVPMGRIALKRRLSSHGHELLNRIPDTATAFGIVVVAGYDPESDWLQIDDLLAPISDSPGVQVLWFGPCPATSELAEEMIEGGKLHWIPRTLSDVLATEADKWLAFAASSTPDEPSLVSLEKGILDVTPAVRLRVEASAAVVDDSWTLAYGELSASVDAFKRFHGDLSGFRGRVEGVGQGFALQRAFEKELFRTVQATLNRLAHTDGVVLLHGQSGTGKSIALARLVSELRTRLKLPVLVSTSRIPSYADVDAFCSEAERAGAPATILICDTNHPFYRYTDLAAALRSRGRKVLIVGSSYLLDSRTRFKSKQLVEAPSTLTNEEISDLNRLLQTWVPDLPHSARAQDDGATTLSMLYRSLSHGRQHITTRVNAEARFAEERLREKSASAPRARKGTSKLAEQLLSAGIASSTYDIFEHDAEAASLGLDAAGKLIDLVMVAGRLSCDVPLSLIMRVLMQNANSVEIDQVIHLFSDLDIFRWKLANKEGTELLIAPRIQLEAELMCRRRLGDVSTEISCIIELIRGVRPQGVDREPERSFLLDLLQKLDRDGPRRDAYKTGYLAFAKALTELREKNGVLEAPLMVRECVFRRQAIFSQDDSPELSTLNADERLAILDEARGIIDEAFRLISAGTLAASKRTRQHLAAERASIYGYLSVQHLRLNDEEGAWSHYQAAKTASLRAISQTEDYPPVDIALWTATDVLKSATLTEERRAEALADLYSALDFVDVDSLPLDQKTRFLEREVKVAAVLEDKALSETALQALSAISPAAAIYLIAKQQVASFDREAVTYTAAERKLAGDTADMIIRSGIEVSDDTRCARLMLRLKWAQCTGHQLLKGDRGPTPSQDADINQLRSIVSGINERAGFEARSSERYLEAVLAWLAKDFSRAIALWNSLSRDTEFEDRTRVVRRLVASDPTGVPLRFRGRVEGAKGQSDWKVKVDGLNTSISLLAHEFSDHDLAHNRELRDFGIAFNYVGPIADPLTRSANR